MLPRTAVRARRRRSRHHWLLGGVALAALPCLPALGQALPTGGAFTQGTGGIAQVGPTITVTQSSARGIISWQSFSIGVGGLVQFNNGNGATLNRVTGGSLSQIDGLLSATGSVYLINPNGVVVGPGGRVVTGGSFVASTLDVSDDAFMAGGTLTFSGSGAGAVSNAGSIAAEGGDVVLIGTMATNTGSIAAPNGTAALAAGNKVVLSAANGPAGIYVVPDSSATGNVTNSGIISAAAAKLAAAGGNVYALAGNQNGLIQATGAATIAGQVWLTAPHGTTEVSGTVTAQNADGSGGRIVADGQQVAIDSTARLSASGTHGGTVLVGVSAPGGVNEAQSTSIAAGARILATGQGAASGGHIETSGRTLTLGAATVDAGPGGSWVLDPTDLTVDATAATTIAGSLNGGTDVTLQTTASGATGAGVQSSGAGDITIDAPISWNTSATLTLSAFNGINVDAAITIAGAGGLVLTTNNNVGGSSTGNGALGFTGGNVSYTGSGGSLTINGNAYTLVSDLTTLGTDIAGNASGHYALATGIDVGGTPYTTEPVTTTFTGTFEGLGNTISNLTINSSDFYVGLFAEVGAAGTIRDIGLVGGSVTATSVLAEVGGLVGYNFGTIENAYNTGSVAGTSSAAIGIYAGGLVGFNSQGTISNSYATGSVTSTATGNIGGGFSIWAGGLLGYSFHGTLSNDYATGGVTSTVTGTSSVTGSIAAYAGGLLGFGYDSTVSNSHATGTVTGSIPGSISASGTVSTYVGGLLGGDFASTAITDAYATGSVTTSQSGSVSSTGTTFDAGGLIGNNEDASITSAYASGAVSGGAGSNVGGLVGNNETGTITNAYATGAVSGGVNSVVGGLVGDSSSFAVVTNAYAIGTVSGGAGSLVGGLIGSDDGQGTFTNLYWDTQTSGTTTGIASGSSTGLTGLTTLQWLSLGPVATSTFDTTSTWVAGYPYPVLQALPYVLITGAGTMTHGTSTPDIAITSITDQNGNDATALVNTSGLAWITLATSSSPVGASFVIGGDPATVSAGYQLTYNGMLIIIAGASSTPSLPVTALPVVHSLPQPVPWDSSDWLRLLPDDSVGPLPEIINTANTTSISTTVNGYDVSTGLPLVVRPEASLYETSHGRHPKIRLPPPAPPAHLQGAF